MKKLTTLFLTLLLALSLIACSNDSKASADAAAFTVIVTDLEGNETTFEYSSDATYVGDVLLEEGLIAGEDSEYGLYVTEVNGITADWDADQTYWAFYVDGEYAVTGVDTTEITEGAEYSFVLTKGE